MRSGAGRATVARTMYRSAALSVPALLREEEPRLLDFAPAGRPSGPRPARGAVPPPGHEPAGHDARDTARPGEKSGIDTWF